MKERLNDLRNKEVINIFDGTRLGYVFDVGLDTETAALTCLIIDGKSRFWGLLGREEDRVIPWEDVETIGEDTILVRFAPRRPEEKKGILLTRILK